MVIEAFGTHKYALFIPIKVFIFHFTPCGKFSKFYLFLEDQKVLTGFYSGWL